jgi:hypothetical protein
LVSACQYHERDTAECVGAKNLDALTSASPNPGHSTPTRASAKPAMSGVEEPGRQPVAHAEDSSLEVPANLLPVTSTNDGGLALEHCVGHRPTDSAPGETPMCLGIPAQIVRIDDAEGMLATVEVAGVRRQVNIVCVNRVNSGFVADRFGGLLIGSARRC